jgi:hypothetical protein
MTRSRYGWIAGIAGAALAAWYWRGRQARRNAHASDRGEVIFSNRPAASSEGIL